MGFALTLVYAAFVFLRPQELHPSLIAYRPMDVLAGIAAVATGLSIATGGSRPLLGGPEWRLWLAYVLWASVSVALAVRWFGGAYATLMGLSIPLFAFGLIVANVSTRRRLAVLVGVTWVCMLVLVGQAVHAYYSGVARSPFFLTQAARGDIDFLADSGGTSDVVITEPGDDAGEAGKSRRGRTGASADDPDAAAGADDAADGADAGEGAAATAAAEDRPPERAVIKRIRALGFLADPNDFAQALICLLPLLFVAWEKRRPFRNAVLVLVPSGAVLWAVLLTRSRGGLVALAGVIAAAVIYRQRPGVRRPVGIAALVSAIPGFVLLFGYAKADASAVSRLEAWSAGLQMLKSSPVWGVGFGQFTEYHERVAHNSFVQCFAETGLVGYFLWLACITVALLRVSSVADDAEDRALARWARALRLSLIGFLVAALFLSRTTSTMLFILIAAVAVCSSMAVRAGVAVRLPRLWWATVLGVEFLSVVMVWVTARASH